MAEPIVYCAVCTKPLRTRHEHEVAVCSSCGPAYRAGAKAALAPLRKLVDEQAEDEGLWFIGQTAPEAYLQQALRRLHAAIEGEP